MDIRCPTNAKWTVRNNHFYDAEAFPWSGCPRAGSDAEGSFFFESHLSDDSFKICCHDYHVPYVFVVFSALDCSSCQSRDDLPLEEHKHNERWNCDNNHIRKKQVPLRTELTYISIQGELDSYVVCAWQEVKW